MLQEAQSPHPHPQAALGFELKSLSRLLGQALEPLRKHQSQRILN
jgi:hypothetical protein